MKTKVFESLFLNIGDMLEISLENFYYIMEKSCGQKLVFEGYNKGKEDGWIHCPKITGEYRGCKSPGGEISSIKIRVLSPFKMGTDYYDYISINASAITEIIPIQKKEADVIDHLCHTLTMKKNINEN